MRIPSVILKTCLCILICSLAACAGVVDQGQELDQGGNDSLESTLIADPVIEDPIMDGIINDQEWQNAEVHLFDDGSELFLLVSGEHLYLAIRSAGSGMIAGNVFLREGSRIMILHTSAALGTAIYQEEGEMYQKIKDFSWCCRSKIDDEASRIVRETFYTEEGWLGQNSFLGTVNELEYKIKLGGQPDKMAVNFIHADDVGEKLVWPVGLKDGVSLPSSGGFPDQIGFSVEEWMSLEQVQ